MIKWQDNPEHWRNTRTKRCPGCGLVFGPRRTGAGEPQADWEARQTCGAKCGKKVMGETRKANATPRVRRGRFTTN